MIKNNAIFSLSKKNINLIKKFYNSIKQKGKNKHSGVLEKMFFKYTKRIYSFCPVIHGLGKPRGSPVSVLHIMGPIIVWVIAFIQRYFPDLLGVSDRTLFIVSTIILFLSLFSWVLCKSCIASYNDNEHEHIAGFHVFMSVILLFNAPLTILSVDEALEMLSDLPSFCFFVYIVTFFGVIFNKIIMYHRFKIASNYYIKKVNYKKIVIYITTLLIVSTIMATIGLGVLQLIFSFGIEYFMYSPFINFIFFFLLDTVITYYIPSCDFCHYTGIPPSNYCLAQ